VTPDHVPTTRPPLPHPPPATDDRPPVELLRWPDEDDRRRLLAALGRPRLLLLAPAAPAPTAIDDLELWIPEGSDARLIATAVDVLQDKALTDDTEPVLDDDGLLRYRGQWIAVPATQIPLVDLLVRNYQRVVRNDDLRLAYQRAGGSGTMTSLRSVISRVNRRFAELGLVLQVIRSRGVLLTNQPAATI
jgi:hypothetical protein